MFPLLDQFFVKIHIFNTFGLGLGNLLWLQWFGVGSFFLEFAKLEFWVLAGGPSPFPGNVAPYHLLLVYVWFDESWIFGEYVGAEGRFSHISKHVGPFCFVCASAWWEYITILLRISVSGHFVMSITKNHESHYVTVLDNSPNFCSAKQWGKRIGNCNGKPTSMLEKQFPLENCADLLLQRVITEIWERWEGSQEIGRSNIQQTVQRATAAVMTVCDSVGRRNWNKKDRQIRPALKHEYQNICGQDKETENHKLLFGEDLANPGAYE